MEIYIYIYIHTTNVTALAKGHPIALRLQTLLSRVSLSLWQKQTIGPNCSWCRSIFRIYRVAHTSIFYSVGTPRSPCSRPARKLCSNLLLARAVSGGYPISYSLLMHSDYEALGATNGDAHSHSVLLSSVTMLHSTTFPFEIQLFFLLGDAQHLTSL